MGDIKGIPPNGVVVVGVFVVVVQCVYVCSQMIALNK